MRPDELGDEAPGASRLVLPTEKQSGELFEVLLEAPPVLDSAADGKEILEVQRAFPG